MPFTETVTQRTALANAGAPVTLNSTAVSSGAVDMSKNKRAWFIAVFGATVGGTVTLSLQESTDNVSWPADGTASPFSNSGGVGTQLALAPPVASKEYTFEVRADQLTTGKLYTRLNANASANNNLIALIALGEDAAQKPGNAANGTNVSTQTVLA